MQRVSAVCLRRNCRARDTQLQHSLEKVRPSILIIIYFSYKKNAYATTLPYLYMLRITLAIRNFDICHAEGLRCVSEKKSLF